MRRVAFGCCSLLLALARGADAGDAWSSVAPVDTVTVRIHWVSLAELAAAAHEVGKQSANRPLGFSILRKNVATDGYVCDIYLPQRPERVDDRPTVSLGHEMAHCLGFSHEQSRAARN